MHLSIHVPLGNYPNSLQYIKPMDYTSNINYFLCLVNSRLTNLVVLSIILCSLYEKFLNLPRTHLNLEVGNICSH